MHWNFEVVFDKPILKFFISYIIHVYLYTINTYTPEKWKEKRFFHWNLYPIHQNKLEMAKFDTTFRNFTHWASVLYIINIIQKGFTWKMGFTNCGHSYIEI